MIPTQAPTAWDATHYVQMTCGAKVFVACNDASKVHDGAPVIHNCNIRKMVDGDVCVILRAKEFKT